MTKWFHLSLDSKFAALLSDGCLAAVVHLKCRVQRGQAVVQLKWTSSCAVKAQSAVKADKQGTATVTRGQGRLTSGSVPLTLNIFSCIFSHLVFSTKTIVGHGGMEDVKNVIFASSFRSARRTSERIALCPPTVVL